MKSSLHCVLVGFLTLLVSACATTGRATDPMTLQDQMVRDERLVLAGMPLRWWESFDDPALTKLLDIALRANLDLAIAAERIRELRAERQLAAASLSPSTTLSGAAGREFGGSDSYRYGMDLAWELDVFGRLRSTRNAADAEVQASSFDYQSLRLSLMAEVATAYLQLRLGQQQVQLAERTSAALKRTTELIDARRKRGLATRLDIERMIAQDRITQAEIPAASQRVTVARHALTYLLANNLEAVNGIIAEGPQQPKSPHNDAVADLLKLPVELLRLRPDVRAAGERVQAAGDHLAAARASRFPQFTLGLLGGFERGVDGPTWSISTQLLQPLFDFGRIRSRIEGADARLAQSRLAYDAALRQAARDSQTAIHAYGQGLIRLQHLDQATAAAERAARLARRQYEAGTVSMLEVLDAERSLFDIQRSQALATSELGQHWIDIYHTLGVGPALRPEEENDFHSDVVTVSAGPAAP